MARSLEDKIKLQHNKAEQAIQDQKDYTGNGLSVKQKKYDKAMLQKRVDKESRILKELTDEYELAKEKAEESEAEIGPVKQLIADYDMRFIQEQKMYLQKIDGVYSKFDRASMPLKYDLLVEAKNWRGFSQALETHDRKYFFITASFRDDVSPTTFNIVSKDNWVIPEDGGDDDYNPLFDDLLKALGNEEQDKIDHIEQVLYYKIAMPWTTRLPCMVFFGEGGTGKTLLIEKVGGAIFGGLARSLKENDVLGTHNSSVEGMAIVGLNEGRAMRANMEAFKDLVGSPTITINPKNVQQYTVENTPLYIACTNDADSSVRLSGDNSDRRWSIIRVGRPLVTIIAERLETSEEWVEDQMKDGWDDTVFGNPDEVQKWVNHLHLKWDGLSCPPAFQGSDFATLMIQQESKWQSRVRAVFEDPSFENIEAGVLYIGYCELAGGAGAKYTMAPAQFYSQLRNFVKAFNITAVVGVEEEMKCKTANNRDKHLFNAKKTGSNTMKTKDNYIQNIERFGVYQDVWCGPKGF